MEYHLASTLHEIKSNAKSLTWNVYVDASFGVLHRLSSLSDRPGTLSEGLWRRGSTAGAFTPLEKRAYGIADDM
jgi:hypothetical protein